jgi:hypothetical protein
MTGRLDYVHLTCILSVRVLT